MDSPAGKDKVKNIDFARKVIQLFSKMKSLWRLIFLLSHPPRAEVPNGPAALRATKAWFVPLGTGKCSGCSSPSSCELEGLS